MRVKIVNEQEKDLVYLLHDVSPELNVPTIPEDSILIVGKSNQSMQQITEDNVSSFFKDSPLFYTLFINEVPAICIPRPTEENWESMADTARSTIKHAFTEKLDRIREVREENGRLDECLDNYETISFTPSSLISDHYEWLFYGDTGRCLKSYADEKLFSKLAEMNKKLNALSSYLFTTYITFDELNVGSDPVLPNGVQLIEVSDIMKSNINVPPFNIEYPDLDDSDVDNKVEKMEGVLSGISERLETMQWFEHVESYARLKFKAYDPFEKEYIQIDEVTIDHNSVKFSYDPDTMQYTIDCLAPNSYVLRVKKKGYITVWLKMQTQINEAKNLVEFLDLGSINMISLGEQLKFIFTWGEIPADLDTHVYAFDGTGVVHEHAFFRNLKSETSMIEIDHDDVDSYGPETTWIRLPRDDFYYLFTIHNYSLHYYGTPDLAHMNLDGLTNVEIKMYDESINVQPKEDYSSYWWDVCILHAGTIYILNEAPTDRKSYFSYKLSQSNIAKLLSKISTFGIEKHNIQRNIPSEIRF